MRTFRGTLSLFVLGLVIWGQGGWASPAPTDLQLCVDKRLRGLLETVSQLSPQVSWRSEGLLRRLDQHQVFTRIFVSVHQLIKFQEETAALIRSRDSFRKAPRLMLVTGDYPITSASLLHEASRLILVPGGNLSKSQVFLAHEIHVVGGHPTACLANTLADMLLDFVETPHSTVYLFLYPRLIYSGEVRLSDIIFQSTVRDRPDVLRAWAANIFRANISDMVPAPPGSSHNFEIAVGRGKKVQVTFVSQ